MKKENVVNIINVKDLFKNYKEKDTTNELDVQHICTPNNNFVSSISNRKKKLLEIKTEELKRYIDFLKEEINILNRSIELLLYKRES